MLTFPSFTQHKIRRLFVHGKMFEWYPQNAQISFLQLNLFVLLLLWENKMHTFWIQNFLAEMKKLLIATHELRISSSLPHRVRSNPIFAFHYEIGENKLRAKETQLISVSLLHNFSSSQKPRLESRLFICGCWNKYFPSKMRRRIAPTF